MNAILRAWPAVLILAALPSGSSAQIATFAVTAGERRLELQLQSWSQLGSFAGLLGDSLEWTPVRAGLSWTELELSASSLGIPIRAIVARIEPGRFRFTLETATKANRMSGAWTIDSASADAAFAVNAGQFKEAGPWGWLRIDGVDRGLPGAGALAYGIAFDSATLRWIAPGQLAAARRDGSIQTAFQSYPQLLVNGRVPLPALNRKLVDHTHRDARLILTELADGTLLFVLTRFDALGGLAERVPVGLTLPESVLLAMALGARQAIMLDGGVSAQLLLRDNAGRVRRWPGLRQVPVGMIAIPR